jgi:primosomal protein N' (replication factor Y)
MRGEARVVVGARSALFLPFHELGLIIVDEEHEQAYKQEDGVIYHARDMAVVRGISSSAPSCWPAPRRRSKPMSMPPAGDITGSNCRERHGSPTCPRSG